jgi:hypothetical protein
MPVKGNMWTGDSRRYRTIHGDEKIALFWDIGCAIKEIELPELL